MMVHNNKMLPHAFGQNNTSSVCWFNALFQALLSCTPMTEMLLLSENIMQANPFALKYIDSLKRVMGATNDANETNKILVEFLRWAKNMKNHDLEFRASCADEAFCLLLDAFKSEYIDQLFKTKYNSYKECAACRAVSKSEDIVYISRVDCNAPLNDPSYLQKYLGAKPQVCDDYKCEKCGALNKKARQCDCITFVSPILALGFNRLFMNNPGAPQIELPPTLKFQARGSEWLEYRLMSTVNYQGYHYTATCSRNDSSLYSISDSLVDKVGAINNSTVFIAFYVYHK